MKSPGDVAPSTLHRHLCDRFVQGRAIAILAGLYRHVPPAMSCNSKEGIWRGFVASDLVQAFPLVASVWTMLDYLVNSSEQIE